jgi:sulfur carrier protein ThiS
LTALEMVVQVTLYGTLRKRFPAYDAANGLSVQLQPGAGVADLVALLGLGEVRLGFISVDGRIVHGDVPLRDGARVRIFQPIFGG